LGHVMPRDRYHVKKSRADYWAFNASPSPKKQNDFSGRPTLCR
jgi:hypothetical protein